jgi:hypothetical protein
VLPDIAFAGAEIPEPLRERLVAFQSVASDEVSAKAHCGELNALTRSDCVGRPDVQVSEALCESDGSRCSVSLRSGCSCLTSPEVLRWLAELLSVVRSVVLRCPLPRVKPPRYSLARPGEA